MRKTPSGLTKSPWKNSLLSFQNCYIILIELLISKISAGKKILFCRQHHELRDELACPPKIRKFLPNHSAQHGSWCSLFAMDFVRPQCMTAAVGCLTLLWTARAWSEDFCFELNLTSKTAWHSIHTVSSSTRGAIWTGLCTHSPCHKWHASGTSNYLRIRMCWRLSRYVEGTDWSLALSRPVTLTSNRSCAYPLLSNKIYTLKYMEL